MNGKQKFSSEKTTTVRIRTALRDEVKKAAKKEKRTILAFVDRSLSAAVRRPTKITREALEII